MATAIIDLELERFPEEIAGLERYQKALILIRLKGRPIGQTTLPINHGRIDGTALQDALLRLAAWPYWENRLHEHLGWDPVKTTNFVPPRATVAVCTRDRPEDLRRCLQALSSLPDDGQELLVVDNCPSTDATRRLVEEYPRVRYVREDRRGASAARNRALREASHEVVAFSDDDATPDRGWLRALLRNFDDPLVLCVTGLTMPLELETDAQECFERHSPFGRGFERFVLDWENCNPLHVARAGTSANMALRKRIGECVGFFDEALGPGTPCRTGEDFDLFCRILSAGYRIVYEPRALSSHRHRRTWEELRSTLYGYGVGVYAFLTRSLLIERQFGAPLVGWGWLRYGQLPALSRCLLRRSGRIPLNLLLAEFLGCIVGPWAYFSSRRHLRKRTGIL